MSISADEALTVLENLITDQNEVDEGLETLSDIQESVFCQCWEGCSYQQIAESIGYEPDYIKKIGYQLWRILSKALGIKVTKKNLHVVLRQHWQSQLERSSAIEIVKPISSSNTMRRDWGEAINVSWFWGRNQELEVLQQSILGDRSTIVTIVGIGGSGKTALSIKLAQRIQNDFEYLIWRSLRDVPPFLELIADIIKFLSNQQQSALPETTSGRISVLLELLQQHRCLIVLDNFESLFRGGEDVGHYLPGNEAYGELIQCIGAVAHKSCLILTSREKPDEIATLEGDILPVRSLQLSGLDYGAAHKLINAKGLQSSEDEVTKLVDLYQGNPLALKIAATSIQDIFSGNIQEFLEQGTVVFNGIRRLIDQQLQRLSALEIHIMYWLAISREPVTVNQIAADLFPSVANAQVLEALEFLSRRSLIEKNAPILHGSTLVRFSQQPAVMEHVLDDFNNSLYAEIVSLDLKIFISHCLLKTQTQDYLRESQIRLILRPLVERLLSHFGSEQALEDHLKQILVMLRQKGSHKTGYAAGNILNLLWQIESNLSGWNFSCLSIWRAYLPNVFLYEANFSQCNFTKTVFANTFGGIISVSLSSNGKSLSIGDTTGNIYLWDIVNGKQQFASKGHYSWVLSTAFSSDSKLLASGAYDYLTKLWNVETGECLATLEGHTLPLSDVAFSPDSQTLATCSQDETIRLWSLGIRNSDNKSQPISLSVASDPRILRGHIDRIWSIAFSPDGKTLVSGAEDKTIKLWDVETGECYQTLLGHSGWVRSVTFSRNGQLIASGSYDKSVRLWDVSTGQCIQTFQGHTQAILAVVFTPDGQKIASASFDKTIKLWDISTGQCLRTLEGHTNRIWTLAISPNGEQLASGGDDNAVKFWNIKTGKCTKTIQGHTNTTISVDLSPNRKYLASGHEDQTVKLWDFQTGKLLKTLRGHSNRIWSVVYAPVPIDYLDVNHFPSKIDLASGSCDGTIKLWNSESGDCIATLQGHTSWVWCVAFSSTGTLLASSSYDQTIRLWDVRSGQCLQTLLGHKGPIVHVTFSPNDRLLASSSFDGTIKLWDIGNEECLRTLSDHTDNVWSVVFSPNGQYLASCSYDNTVKLWDVSTGECLQTFQGHTAPITAIAYSPDGKHLASAGFDRTICFWDIATGQSNQIAPAHTDVIPKVMFTPDGSQLISCSFDETIKIWDISTQTCLQSLRAPRPYEGMNITGATGLNEAELSTLEALGAVRVVVSQK